MPLWVGLGRCGCGAAAGSLRRCPAPGSLRVELGCPRSVRGGLLPWRGWAAVSPSCKDLRKRRPRLAVFSRRAGAVGRGRRTLPPRVFGSRGVCCLLVCAVCGAML